MGSGKTSNLDISSSNLAPHCVALASPLTPVKARCSLLKVGTVTLLCRVTARFGCLDYSSGSINSTHYFVDDSKCPPGVTNGRWRY